MTSACLTQRTQPSLTFGPRNIKSPINWVPAAIALAVFIFDLTTPRGLAAAALYVLAPAACLWVPHAVLSSRMALITSALIVVMYLLDFDGGVPSWIALANTAIAIVLVWSVTWMVGLRNRQVRAVAALAAEVQALRGRAEAAEASACAEISRRLHDSVAQQLTAVGWGLDDIRNRPLDPQHVRAAASRLRELIGASQDTIKRLAVDLRRRSINRATAPGETRAHVARFSQCTGIRTDVSGEQLLSELSNEGAYIAFLVIQESLANVGKHADASSAHVEVSETDSGILIAITDDGRGFVEMDRMKSASLGLVGLEERLRAAGGLLRIGGAEGQGTRLSTVIPRAASSD